MTIFFVEQITKFYRYQNVFFIFFYYNNVGCLIYDIPFGCIVLTGEFSRLTELKFWNSHRISELCVVGTQTRMDGSWICAHELCPLPINQIDGIWVEKGSESVCKNVRITCTSVHERSTYDENSKIWRAVKMYSILTALWVVLRYVFDTLSNQYKSRKTVHLEYFGHAATGEICIQQVHFRTFVFCLS